MNRCKAVDTFHRQKLFSFYLVTYHSHKKSVSYKTDRKSRDSSVGIALDYGLDDRGSRVRLPAGAGNFSLHYNVQNGSGAHSVSIQWVPGSLSLGVKRPGREADHSPPSSAEVKE
jgi:hypothetical protein